MTLLVVDPSVKFGGWSALDSTVSSTIKESGQSEVGVGTVRLKVCPVMLAFSGKHDLIEATEEPSEAIRYPRTYLTVGWGSIVFLSLS